MLNNNFSLSRMASVVEEQNGKTASLNFTNPTFKLIPINEFLKKYKLYLYNRGGGTDLERAKQIANDIIAGDTFWLVNPITVDPKTRIIIDGNTTAEALRMLHEDYGYQFDVSVIEKQIPNGIKTGKAVQLFNNLRKGWTLDDYVVNYIKEGYADYKRLQEMTEALGEFFYEKEGERYRWRYASALCGKNCQDKLRDGEYKLSVADKEKQIEFGKEVKAIWEAVGCPRVGPWMEPFIFAVYKVKTSFGKNYNINTWIEKFRSHGTDIFNGSLSTNLWQENILGVLMK